MPFPLPYERGQEVTIHHFVARPGSVRRARQHVQHKLSQWRLEECADALLLAISEIVTNSVKAVGALTASVAAPEQDQPPARIVLRLRLTDEAIWAEVWDSGPGEPVATTPECLDESGRGLSLVAAVCDAWGHYPARNSGKVTWCTIKIPSRPAY